MNQESGAEALCNALEAAGVDFVFGLPGTQTVGLYDALRRSRLRAVVPTHELGAAFMAMGYARASGKVGVLLTIPGPGFAYALAGLAEAKLDGVALLHITLKPARGPTGQPAFQAIDQVAVAAPLVKRVFSVDDRAGIPHAVREAIQLALASDPGPVLLELSERILSATGAAAAAAELAPALSADNALDELIGSVSAARRPVVLIACDCTKIADSVAFLAKTALIPICVPPPSKGLIAEDHPWGLCFDDQRTNIATLNELLARSDLVLLLGSRLGHVSTAGFRLILSAQKTVVVSSVPGSLPHGYSARLAIRAEPDAVIARLLGAAERMSSEWTSAEMVEWRNRFSRDQPLDPPEPTIDAVTPAVFFGALRQALPRDAIVVTDSGLHQVMVRRHFPVLAHGGLIFPSDFQSMGFGLPAAIGARLAASARPVVAIVGDGGFAMNGLELATAVRDHIPVVVMVMNDGKLNLIRVQQIREFGRAHGVDLEGPDLEYLAAALGVKYRRLSGDCVAAVAEALSAGEPVLIDVPVGDSPAIQRTRLKSLARETVRGALGPSVVAWLKRRLR